MALGKVAPRWPRTLLVVPRGFNHTFTPMDPAIAIIYGEFLYMFSYSVASQWFSLVAYCTLLNVQPRRVLTVKTGLNMRANNSLSNLY
jgi:hypothetical protein